jgi:hypothetical protein
MANSFGSDILIQAPDPKEAARSYVRDPCGLTYNLTRPPTTR